MRLSNYLHSQLAISFFPIFLGLFFITSVVFLVKIASLTSVITMTSFELLKLYIYSIPQVVFYTLPISFFMSLAICLSKLSSEYELVVITSYGLNPLNIIKILFPVTAFLTIFLLIISLGLIPKTKYLTKSFSEIKKKEANFNIKESEFGQKFGDWLIYINKKNENIYKEVTLFKSEKNSENFIVSDEALLENDKNHLSFKLINGKVFAIDDNELSQIDYSSMYINDSITNTDIEAFDTSYNFWKRALKHNKDIDDFSFYILSSIFPLISLFLVIVFGYFNPRYEKNRAVVYSVLTVVIYYVFIKYIGERLLLHSLYIIPTIWIMFSYIIYSKTTKKEY
ncbi:permease [Aliarcobacter trophiarum LMG 25534]|uniref:Permease n=1 Tax=Aliarcobacter trophiarum LMG 25534 TaxID=1032241 RepID=A0AAD0VMT2_9BACT|nr:LptF/LptG family permease [Aliarcobacter trophiarum]AXK49622.1 lipooligosaccharide transport system, ABC transporter permease component LptF [Aliarcobacter trophiarum LMG 25534]RXI27462.1 permease [Aliarcobacter trophiarum]RXJ92292.1 permease [Aliarcobacter trophiarum LMG 25534]